MYRASSVVFAYMTQLMLELDNPAAHNGELSRFAVALGNELLLALSLEVNLKDCISSKSQALGRQVPPAQSAREGVWTGEEPVRQGSIPPETKSYL